MAKVYIVDMILYPSFGKPPAGLSESDAAVIAQKTLDDTLSSGSVDQRAWLSRGYQGSYDSATLAAKVNAYAEAQLAAVMAGSFVGTIKGVSVAQPGEWSTTGGGHHACIMPVVAEVSAYGGPSDTLEWELTTVGTNPFTFVVFAEVRWKSIDIG